MGCGGGSLEKLGVDIVEEARREAGLLSAGGEIEASGSIREEA